MGSLAAPGLLAALLESPAATLATLSWRGWTGLALSCVLAYAYTTSLLARRSKNMPCPNFGAVFRLMYGLFGMWIGEAVLGYFGHTKATEEQAEQATLQTIIGEPELRIKLVPILGGMFGGNYAFLLWDEDDPHKRAIAVDPADPQVVLRAAEVHSNMIALMPLHVRVHVHVHDGTIIRRAQVPIRALANGALVQVRARSACVCCAPFRRPRRAGFESSSF